MSDLEKLIDLHDKRWEVERFERWRDLEDEIPEISFPEGWSIKFTPPWAGAVARFSVFSKGRRISVYLDWYDRLGAQGEPYWEIMPGSHESGEPERFPVADVEGLLAGLQASFDARDADEHAGLLGGVS